MTLTISVPDRLVGAVPIAELSWVNGQDLLFDHLPGLEVTTTYQNYADEDIWVAERSGAIHCLQPRHSNLTRAFCIKIGRRKQVATATFFDLSAMVDHGPGALRAGSSLQAMEKSYQPQNGRSTGMHICNEVMFQITSAELKNLGGVIYHQETDVVLCTKREHAVHPGSPQSRLHHAHFDTTGDFQINDEDDAHIRLIKEEFQEFAVEKGTLNMARVMIGIIDNERVFGDKYVNLLGRAHLVKSRRSTRLTPGVYVCRNEETNKSGRASNATITRYSFEDVVESGIPLFSNKADALNYGDPTKAAEQRSEEIKAQNLLLKSQLDQQQTESKIALAKTQDHFENRGLQRKDNFEDRSYHRKDDSENMKYVFAAVAGFFGLLAVILK